MGIAHNDVGHTCLGEVGRAVMNWLKRKLPCYLQNAALSRRRPRVRVPSLTPSYFQRHSRLFARAHRAHPVVPASVALDSRRLADFRCRLSRGAWFLPSLCSGPYGSVASRRMYRRTAKSAMPAVPTGHARPSQAELDLLERRLTQSRATVVIPLDDRVLFVRSLNYADFSGRFSEIA